MKHVSIHPKLFSWTAVLLAAVALVVLAASNDELTPQEQQGKQIYMNGTSPSGHPVVALMGEEKTEVAANLLPCVNCHGADGRGRPEGGVYPSNIIWENLTKPYGVRHETGRRHPPYTATALEKAIVAGVDPAGNELNPAMPRYRMSEDDLQALMAYLHRVGKERDPGVSDDSIRLGLLLPPGSLMAAESLRRVLQAYFGQVNGAGGVYGRRLDLETYYLPADPAQAEAAVREFVEEKEIFALISPYLVEREEALCKLADLLALPMVGPITLRPQVGFPLNRHVFYLLSGVATQTRALIEFTARENHREPLRLALVAPHQLGIEDAAEAVRDEVYKLEWPELQEIRYASGEFKPLEAVKQLGKAESQVVVFLGRDAEASAWLSAADSQDFHPIFLSPASLAGASLFQAPPAFSGKLLSSAATLPRDYRREAVREFLSLVEEADLPRQGRPQQISTLAAAKVLVEGLRRTGRELTREKLVSTLEGFYDFGTGLTPPISYNPNRRIGAMGAHVLRADLEQNDFVPQGPFLELKD